jgi:hypothetical protein
MVEKLTNHVAPEQPEWRADTRRVLVTRVKRETLENYETEPGPLGRFTLHDASLRAHMSAAVHNVNLRVRSGR